VTKGFRHQRTNHNRPTQALDIDSYLFRIRYHSSETNDRVAGLVYIAALAPDADETSQTQQSNFPRTDVFSYIEVADGRISLVNFRKIVIMTGGSTCEYDDEMTDALNQ